MTPTTPSGSHWSYMRCFARCDCWVKPYSMRDWPAASVAMSMSSRTSPLASISDLPVSSVTTAASASR